MSEDASDMSLADVAAALRAAVDLAAAEGLDELLVPWGEAFDDPTAAPAVAANPERATAAEPEAALAMLEAGLAGCTRCRLHEERRTIVFGVGNPRAALAFVGEGPGADEDRLGAPFVGAAGQLLDKIIQAMGLQRDDVYICNVVKCRPPKNRTPLPEERATCGAFLDQQLEIVAPRIVVALGATAANYLLGTETSLARLRGRFHQRGAVEVMPTYHPAYLLRTPDAKRAVWEDMKLVRDRLGSQR
jgi:DNA polymerase